MVQTLPDTPKNAEFIALYQAIIEGGLEGIEPPAGSGKTMSIQEQLIRTTATNANKAVAVQAEVLMNSYYNYLFNKNINSTLLKGTLAKQPIATWSLLPNPVENKQVVFSSKPGALLGHSSAVLKIYSFNGTLIRQISDLKNNDTILLTDIPAGIYSCVLYADRHYLGIQKLVVVQ